MARTDQVTGTPVTTPHTPEPSQVPMPWVPTLGGFAVAWAAMTLVWVGLGHAVLAWAPGFDPAVSQWFVEQRTDLLDVVSRIATAFSDTLTITVLTIVTVAVAVWRRHWRAAAWVATAVLLKVTVFLATTLLVSRARPDVVALDPAPPTSSFPSGHVASSVAFYLTFALAIAPLFAWTLLRVLAWVLAVLVPIGVVLGRLYRGMHYPTDVVAGLVLGAVAVVVAWYLVRWWAPRWSAWSAAR